MYRTKGSACASEGFAFPRCGIFDSNAEMGGQRPRQMATGGFDTGCVLGKVRHTSFFSCVEHVVD
jgi:hypothetical protein